MLPLSIIIVGIGDADFDQMEQLDGDVTPLYSSALGRYVARDIVQFVPFKQFKNDPLLLAREVLAEVPRQLTDYFDACKIVPNPKKVADKQDLIIQGRMKNQLAQMMKVQDSFFKIRKAATYQTML